MNARQINLLQNIISEYIETAEPVGSKFLTDACNLSISPATVRNEMTVLEQEGYIRQPHTSAGRVPTARGIEYYIEHLLIPEAVTQRAKAALKKMYASHGIRGLAKAAASFSRAAVVVAQNNANFYFTGFSFLFNEPEFDDARNVRSISEAVDQIEEILPDMLKNIHSAEPHFFIGKRCPFGPECSAIFIAYSAHHIRTAFGVLAPLRTNYARHTGLLKTISSYLV